MDTELRRAHIYVSHWPVVLHRGSVSHLFIHVLLLLLLLFLMVLKLLFLLHVSKITSFLKRSLGPSTSNMSASSDYEPLNHLEPSKNRRVVYPLANLLVNEDFPK